MRPVGVRRRRATAILYVGERLTLRQLDVQQDEIEPLSERALLAREPIPLDHDLVTVGLEHRLEQLNVHRIVLNEEKA